MSGVDVALLIPVQDKNNFGITWSGNVIRSNDSWFAA
jgi:hypothetical protein